MNYTRIALGIAVVLAGCAEPEQEATVICWTVGDETNLPQDKYYKFPDTVCVPIVHAPSLPPSIQQRATIEVRRSRESINRPPAPVRPVAPGTVIPNSPAEYEMSEVHKTGPVAGIVRRDGTLEYSSINRETGVVRAVDDKTEINSNDAKRLRNEIFREVGL
ncbi:MAG: hypothetical protein IKD58_03740 [Loktanella sp.]|nr:hypothetical protein [Loktanella sp.]